MSWLRHFGSFVNRCPTALRPPSHTNPAPPLASGALVDHAVDGESPSIGDLERGGTAMINPNFIEENYYVTKKELVRNNINIDAFVNSTVAFLQQYKFDGLDWHWNVAGSAVNLLVALKNAFLPHGYLLSAWGSQFKNEIDKGK